MKDFKIILLAPLLMLSMACSQQWREADDGFASDEVAGSIDQMVAEASTASVDSASVFKKLYENPNSAIYFAVSDIKGITNLGMPWNLLTVQDLSIFGSPGLDVYKLDAVKIALIDDPENGQAALAVSLIAAGEKAEGSNTKFFATSLDRQPEVNDGELSFYFSEGLIARTRDIADDAELNGVIQLKLFVADANGNEAYLGKITTLVGYD